MKKAIKGVIAGLGVGAVALTAVAIKKKPGSVYDDKPEEKNPMEGKKVKFVENEDEPANADGVRGHLEAVGETNHVPTFYEKYVKRGTDIVLSLGGLVALSPVFLGLSLWIKADDPGPVLFTQKRVGKDKKYFKLHKFRSMKMDTPQNVPTHMLENPEQYITRAGKFIRAHSLDELPQIWDIFIGNMSVVGPRPALWNQDLLTAERDKYGANDIKPGLTGWAQINGRDELEIPVKARLDGEYTKSLSPLMDAQCFLGSIGVFAKDDSVVEGGTGEIHKKLRPGVPETDPTPVFGCDKEIIVDETVEKNILITGAGSYIGESFKSYAAEHYPNLHIDVLDMIGDDWRDTDFSSYDTVYHVAGIAHADVGNVDDATKEKYYKVNTDLAIEVCRKAKEAGVKQFVFMSSMIVYGESAPFGTPKIITRDTVPLPANFYGDSKWQADKGVRALEGDGFKVAVLRPPMIYGRGSKGNYPTLAKIAKKLPVFPDIDNQRSMLHIDNLCEFLCQLIMSGEGGIYFPQNGEYTKTSDMVRMIGRVSGNNVKSIRLLNPAVGIASHVPGKVCGLVNKAFGNSCYDQGLSNYSFEYQILGLKPSIRKTEEYKDKGMKSRIEALLDEYIPSQKPINVFIIGLRGYTQNYGGWEAFAQGLLNNWIDKDVQWWAYEKVDSPDKEEIEIVNNVICIRVYEGETGSSAMPKYDLHCTNLTCRFVKRHNISNPIMYHLGVRIGPLLWFKRKGIKKLGIKMAENPAGAEWRRTKWGKALQIYLYISAIMMAKSTDCMICDNEGIRKLYERILFGRKPILEYVAYGVESQPRLCNPMPQKVQEFFDKWNIMKDDYYLILGRFVPENNYEMMFKGYMMSKSKRKLFVITNYETEIQKFHEYIRESTGYEKDSRIIMAGTLYDSEILHYVRQYAHGYIHGHSVGGTNPGLLESMAETDINICYNVNFNKYVGRNTAVYFKNENDLAGLINKIDDISDDEKNALGEAARKRMDEKYSWKYIVCEYDRVIHRIVKEN